MKMISNKRLTPPRFTNFKKIWETVINFIWYLGLWYTWYIATVFDRLDRVLANRKWLAYFKDTKVKNLPIRGSYHGSNLLTTTTGQASGRYTPFKYEMKSILLEEFLIIVKNTRKWNLITVLYMSICIKWNY